MATLTKEMTEAVAALGELVKADARCTAIRTAVDAYEHSEELNALIAEYNTQQDILADNYAKENGTDEGFTKTVQARINELYDKITTHPVYVDYINAKQEFDGLINEIYGEIQFAVTGQRPCSHDCSSCHSDCHHDH